MKWFIVNRGYGMITDTQTNLDIFVHHTNIISQGWRVLEPRETVEYRVVKTRRGYEALDVISLGPSGFKPVTGYTEKHGGVHARVIYDAEMLKSGNNGNLQYWLQKCIFSWKERKI